MIKSIPVLPWASCSKIALTKWVTLMLEIIHVHCDWKAAHDLSNCQAERKKSHSPIWLPIMPKTICQYMGMSHSMQETPVCVCKGTLPFPQSCKQIISSFLLEWMAKILSSYELRAAFQPLQIFKFLQGAFILVPQSLSCNHNTTQGLCSPSRVLCKRFCKAICAILQP